MFQRIGFRFYDIAVDCLAIKLDETSVYKGLSSTHIRSLNPKKFLKNNLCTKSSKNLNFCYKREIYNKNAEKVECIFNNFRVTFFLWKSKVIK